MGELAATSFDRAGAAWGDAGWFVRLLGIHRRPWRIHEAAGAITLVHREEGLQGLWLIADAGPRITDGRQPLRQGGDRELVGMDVVEFVPVQRRGYLCTRPGAY